MYKFKERISRKKGKIIFNISYKYDNAKNYYCIDLESETQYKFEIEN